MATAAVITQISKALRFDRVFIQVERKGILRNAMVYLPFDQLIV